MELTLHIPNTSRKTVHSMTHSDALFKKLADSLEGYPFTQLPLADPLSEIDIASELITKCTHVCVVGLGGSSLGAKAVAQALALKNLVFLDNVDPFFVEEVLSSLPLKKTLFLLMSKSGSTIEVLTLAEILLKRTGNKGKFLVMSDEGESPLRRLAKKNHLPIISSPSEIPGRFSVLSSVAQIPLALCGGLSDNILAGARNTDWRAAFNLALAQYNLFNSGKNNCVLFPYSERLSRVTDWYIQLLAESIGKSPTIGITPIKALGVKDQHAQLQLFLDGPDDKFTIFIEVKKHSTGNGSIKNSFASLEKLFAAEYKGVIGAYQERNKAYACITVPSISAETIGELLFFFELEVGFLGLLFNINFQNQPAVELSKRITREQLKKFRTQ